MSTALQRVSPQTELATVPRTRVVAEVIPVDPVAQFEQILKMANEVSKSGIGRLNPSQALTLMLLAQARGLPLIEGVMRYHFYNGQATMKADSMLAEFQNAGGSVEWTVDTYEEEAAIFSHPIHCSKGKLVSFTMEDAKRAKLDKKDVWLGNPRSMMRARVISNAVRMILPGVMLGIYTEDEAGDAVIDVTPESDPAVRNKLVATLQDAKAKFGKQPIEPEVIDTTATPSPTPAATVPAPTPQPKTEFGRFAAAEAEMYNSKVADLNELDSSRKLKSITVSQIANHLVKEWIEMEHIPKDAAKTNGKQDSAKVVAIINNAWAGDAGDVQSMVTEYLEAEYAKLDPQEPFTDEELAEQNAA